MPRLSLGLGIQNFRKVGGKSPIPKSGLSLWLKADAGVTLSGSNVTAWADQSGNGNNATPPDAVNGYEPLFVSNSVNGLPTIRFLDSSTSLLVTPSFLAVSYNTPISIIAVAKAVASEVVVDGSAQRWLLPSGASESFEIGFTFGAYGNTSPNYSAMVGSNLVGEVESESSEIIGTETAVVSLTNTGTTVNFHKNGTSVGSLDPSSYSTTNASDGVWGIGAQLCGGSVYLPAKFNLAELVIYNRLITTPERQQVEAYLNTKYAIY
jgi:hypothetical protein